MELVDNKTSNLHSYLCVKFISHLIEILYIYIYIYIYIYRIFIMKKNYLLENIFDLCLYQSILFLQ